MVGPRKIKETITTTGEYNGYKVPEIPGVKITLESKHNVVTSVKTGEVLEKTAGDYTIVLDFTEITHYKENKDLSSDIQEATGLMFSIYSHPNKMYRFFTTARNSDIEKMEKLKNLVEVAQEFSQKNYGVQVKESEMKSDFEKQFTMSNREMMLVPYEKGEIKSYMLVLKGFLADKSDFAKIAGNSFAKGYLKTENELKKIGETYDRDASLNDIKKYFPNFNAKQSYFLIDEKGYDEIKEFMKSKELKEKYTNEEFVRQSKQRDVSLVEITEPNVFGIYIKYDEEKGVFKFKAKDYFKKVIVIRNSPILERSVFGQWAEDKIFTNNMDIIRNNPDIDQTFSLNEGERIAITPLPGGNTKEGYEVPIGEYDKLLLIKENFTEQMKLFGKEEVSIEISASVDTKVAWNHGESLAILLQDNGAYLVSSVRATKKKLKDGQNEENLEISAKPIKEDVGGGLYKEDWDNLQKYFVSKITFTGQKISLAEAQSILDDEMVGKNIATYSRNLSALVALGNKDFKDFTREQIQEVWDTKWLHLQMVEDNNRKDVSSANVRRNMKKF